MSLVPQLAHGEGPESSASKTISRISAGTIVDDPQAARWNRVILLARPRMASGQTTALSESVRTAASKFTLSILASVVPDVAQADASSNDSADRAARFKLEDVGVGHSVLIGNRMTIVTADSATRLGLKLGFLESRVLAENEKQLTLLRLIAKSSTLAIFDAPAIMLRDGSHQGFTMRHLIWIDGVTGDTRTLVWLLRKTKDGRYGVVDESLQLLALGTREDRAIHVDGDKFFLGIPSDQAFALERLPPGRAIAWTTQLEELAADQNYSLPKLAQLSNSTDFLLKSLNQK